MPDNTTFLNLGAEEFLRRYPVTFIDILGASTVGPSTMAALATPPTKGNALTGQGSVSKAKRVWDVTFSVRADSHAPVISARCPTPVKATLDTNGTGISTFYLPYKHNENYRITLDANGPGGANVDFFMTELVDGCSVYIEGTQDKPTCYHINANAYAQTHDPAQPHHLTALAALAGTNMAGLNSQQVHDIQFGFKSQRMDTRFQTDALKRPKTVRTGSPNLQQAKKVEEQDYMVVPGTANETAFNTTMAALQALQIVPTHVNGKTVDEMRFVASQGFIFGIRTGVNWKFYVQRKALVEYFHRTHAIGAKFNQAVKGIARPMNSLGMQNIVRDVKQYWPTSEVGRNA